MKILLILTLFSFTFVVVHCSNETVVVRNCKEVLHHYNLTCGFPVIDCYEDQSNNQLFWRLDSQLNFDAARKACKSASNADLAVVKNFNDQNILNGLYAAKVTLNTWMWLGIRRQNGRLEWIDGADIPDSRWYWILNSRNNGDCGAQLMQTNADSDSDKAGTFYYTANCQNLYISACGAPVPPHEAIFDPTPLPSLNGTEKFNGTSGEVHSTTESFSSFANGTIPHDNNTEIITTEGANESSAAANIINDNFTNSMQPNLLNGTTEETFPEMMFETTLPNEVDNNTFGGFIEDNATTSIEIEIQPIANKMITKTNEAIQNGTESSPQSNFTTAQVQHNGTNIVEQNQLNGTSEETVPELSFETTLPNELVNGTFDGNLHNNVTSSNDVEIPSFTNETTSSEAQAQNATQPPPDFGVDVKSNLTSETGNIDTNLTSIVEASVLNGTAPDLTTAGTEFIQGNLSNPEQQNLQTETVPEVSNVPVNVTLGEHIGINGSSTNEPEMSPLDNEITSSQPNIDNPILSLNGSANSSRLSEIESHNITEVVPSVNKTANEPGQSNLAENGGEIHGEAPGAESVNSNVTIPLQSTDEPPVGTEVPGTSGPAILGELVEANATGVVEISNNVTEASHIAGSNETLPLGTSASGEEVLDPDALMAMGTNGNTNETNATSPEFSDLVPLVTPQVSLMNLPHINATSNDNATESNAEFPFGEGNETAISVNQTRSSNETLVLHDNLPPQSKFIVDHSVATYAANVNVSFSNHTFISHTPLSSFNETKSREIHVEKSNVTEHALGEALFN